MGAFGNFIRSLAPGNDGQLAEDLSARRRQGHRRNIGKAAAQGQAWEEQDRQRHPSGTGWFRRR